MTNPTRMTEMLEQLTREAEYTREQLIENMRSAAKHLLEQAQMLESNPAREPASLGYVSARSTFRDIDQLSISLAERMKVIELIER